MAVEVGVVRGVPVGVPPGGLNFNASPSDNTPGTPVSVYWIPVSPVEFSIPTEAE